MIVSDILDFARGLADDSKLPYLWSQPEFLAYYNRSVDDVCRRVKHLRDSSTASICEIKILAGLATYSYSPKIVQIISAKLASQSVPLDRKDEAWLDRYCAAWRENTGTPSCIIPEFERDKFRLYPFYEDTYVVTGVSNITFTAPHTVSKASGLSIFEEDDEISVSGTTNNGTDAVPKIFTVVTVSDTTIVVSETVTVGDTNTSAILRRVEDTLNLSVARLPLTWVAMGSIPTESPPFDEDYHMDMVHGILSKAYLKDGTETYDPQQAMKHRGLFEEMITKLKRDHIGKTYFEQTCGPARGAI